MIPADKLENEWKTARMLWYSDTGVKMYIDTHFDGYGNAIVRFVIQHEGTESSYEKYDAAAGAYNMIAERENTTNRLTTGNKSV